jgi:hypothetical protein
MEIMTTRNQMCGIGLLALAVLIALPSLGSIDDSFAEMRRGSWVREGTALPGDVVLVPDAQTPPEIVISPDESSCVQQAVRFLAKDIRKITDVQPAIVPAATGKCSAIVVRTRTDDPRWEAYTITVGDGRIVIEGSNARGTAFGIYDLSERLGVDPLYQWTGYVPKKHMPLVVTALEWEQGPPTVKYRGLFHDDEDILPRPNPDAVDQGPWAGDVPTVWYERYFETALRLRLNMVAPYVRVNRRFEIQKMASDWGLYYTSHHYDTLLSDPFHFFHGKLAEQRGIEPVWDWIANRDGLIRYWKAGVDENGGIDAIYPIGMRGAGDFSYRFPQDWTEDQKIAAYNEAFEIQANLVRNGIQPGRVPLMHFTMFTEMLPFYQTQKMKIPDGVIIVWPDNNDGIMRGLPDTLGDHRHGVYYHLAFLGRNIPKQIHQTVPLPRIEKEFRRIVECGATEFCLVNVSELREYVLGTRFIAEICWDAPSVFAKPDAAERYLAWWCREYFGDDAADASARAYKAYFDDIVPEPRRLYYGAEKVRGAIGSLVKRFAGEEFSPAMPETLPTLLDRQKRHNDFHALCKAAEERITDDTERRFFFENLELAGDIDRLNTEAAILLVEAMPEPDIENAKSMCYRALVPLDELDVELRRAERWPFESWYGPTWIEHRTNALVTPRRELVEMLASLSSG